MSSRVRPSSPMSRPFFRRMSLSLRVAASISMRSNIVMSSSKSVSAASGEKPRPIARTISGPLSAVIGSPTLSTPTEPVSESISSRTSASRSISRMVSPPSPMSTPRRSCGIRTCCISVPQLGANSFEAFDSRGLASDDSVASGARSCDVIPPPMDHSVSKRRRPKGTGRSSPSVAG